MNKKILIGAAIVVALGILIVVLPKKTGSKQEVQGAVTNMKEAKELYAQAVKLRQMNDPIRAKAVYQELIKNYSNVDNIAMIQKESEELNLQILFSNQQVPDKTVIHEVVPGDSLAKIAKKYNTTAEFIRRSNNISGDIVRLGEKLRIWTGKFNIFVDKSQNILILKDGNEVVKVYNVSTGTNNSTPIGTFKITTKLVDPVWFNKGMVVPPESPQNVLGSRWMGFDIPGYGIHGTVEPNNIGKQVTAGCVRMINEQVEELYDIVPAGTEVVVVD
ncbi:MAG: L,D-transpeptidase family protein [Candidatus Omnitrophica bacterium]|nr:L,D-transpeptidase family protein [Candidatus Omnitrophota bacterium]